MRASGRSRRYAVAVGGAHACAAARLLAELGLRMLRPARCCSRSGRRAIFASTLACIASICR